MLKVKRINGNDVKPIKFLDEKVDPRPVAGADIFPEIYSNIFISARKKSGKTCAISLILDKCATSETKVIAFTSTLNRDKSWAAIRARLEKRKIDFTGFMSIKDEQKEDVLDNIVKTLEQEADGDGEDSDDDDKTDQDPQARMMQMMLTGLPPSKTKKRKKRKPKYKAPKVIFIFDDLSGELQAPSLTQLLKKNRHFKAKVIMSSQYFNDLALQARKQLDYLMLYKGLAQSMQKLNDIYRNTDLSVPFDVFVALYRYATAKKYNFLYIDVVNSTFRKCFNYEIDLPEEKEEEEVLEI